MSEAKINTYEAIDWATWTPGERATLLFIIEPERILLIHKKRGLGAGKINGPGGRVDPGESDQECAVREVQEELLITPLDPVERGVLQFQFADGYSLEAVVFSATRYEGTPTETEEALPEWFPRDAIPYERMWSDDQYWIPQMLKGQSFHGTFLFDGDEMLGHQLAFND